MSDKTEDPTPKRLRKARDEGDVAISPFAGQAVGFLGAVALAPAAMTALGAYGAGQIGAAIARAKEASPSASFEPAAVLWAVVGLVTPVLLASAIASAFASVVQTGGVFAPTKLAPKLERLDVFAGLKQLVSATRLAAMARAGIFSICIALLAVLSLRAHASDFAHAQGDTMTIARVAGAVSLEVAKRAALVGLFLAVIDILVVRRAWMNRLRMTKTEVKREHRESEGDPQIKAARERAHHEMMASVLIAKVKEASVVIVNPTHIACALRYDQENGDEAPVVLASGQGELAERIVQAAKAHGVPVLRDVPLARALVELEVGVAIPEALYEAVAEILRAAWEEAEKSP